MDRFGFILEGLCRAVAAGRGGMPGSMILLIWGRLRRMAVRFASLAARARAGGVVPRVRVRPIAAKRPDVARVRLPRGFAWLVPLVPGSANFGSQLQHLLTDPEMVALLAAAPGMGRVMRPLCQMLGVRFEAPAPAAVAEGAPAERSVCGDPIVEVTATPAPEGPVGRAAPS